MKYRRTDKNRHVGAKNNTNNKMTIAASLLPVTMLKLVSNFLTLVSSHMILITSIHNMTVHEKCECKCAQVW